MNNFELTAFDLVMALIILIGIARGRKRGISEELLDVLKWIAIVVAAGLGHRYVADFLVLVTKMPPSWSRLLGYIFILVVMMFLFKSIKRAVGQKLVEGDTFGRFEFYLGMLAGAVRFFCVTFVVLAMINSKYSTPAERAASAKMQQENFGDIRLIPSIPTLQQKIFVESASGKFIHKQLGFLLVDPAPPGPARENVFKRREGAVNEVIQ
jgi:uncharacterized membrane protein required for colicin V production